MNTEDDFQAMLDANPADSHTRLVFADWLEDRGDERAEGYRALGALRVVPNGTEWSLLCPWLCSERADDWKGLGCVLPNDWFDLMELRGKSPRFAPDHNSRRNATRREVEDAAARAFALLPVERRAQLLQQTAVTA